MGAKQQGATATAGRWLVIPRTLSFVFYEDEVLLMKRAPHKKIFPNQYNGLGGHIEANEDPYGGAYREIQEESGLDVANLRLCGVHHINTGEATGIMLFVFVACALTRDVIADEREGTLHWVAVDKLADYDLVEDLPLLLPRLVAMRAMDAIAPYHAFVSYDENDQIQIRYATE